MGQVDIFKIEPDAYYAAKQIVQWAEIVPEWNMPAGKIFVLGKGRDWVPNQVLKRGMTQIQHNDLSGVSEADITALKNAGKTYHSVPITPELLGIGATGPNEWVGDYAAGTLHNKLYFPNGLPTYEQGLAYGQNCDISHKITIGETMENNHYTSPNAAFWAGYYEAKSARLTARFGAGNWAMAHDYLFASVAPSWSDISEAQAKAYFRNPATLPNYNFITGTLKDTNMFTGSGYLGMPDRDKRYVYDNALSARLCKRIGKKFVNYFDPERESMPNMLTANIVGPNTLYLHNKMPSPSPIAAGLVSVGLHFGDGFVTWNGAGKVTNKKWSTYWMQQLFGGSYWVKQGETMHRSSDSWPNLSGDQSYTVVNWGSCIDFAAFAAYQWYATLGQVEGGVTKAARYRINGGPWYNPVNTFEDDLCYAKYNQAPIVETKLKDGKEGLYFIDPCSQNNKKIVDVIGQTGQQHTFEACGNTPHLALANA